MSQKEPPMTDDRCIIFFYRPDSLPVTQPIAVKHWKAQTSSKQQALILQFGFT